MLPSPVLLPQSATGCLGSLQELIASSRGGGKALKFQRVLRDSQETFTDALILPAQRLFASPARSPSNLQLLSRVGSNTRERERRCEG